MKFRLEFDCDNDAFHDYPFRFEMRMIMVNLKKAVSEMTGHETSGTVMDINGNRIGQWSLAEPCARWTLNAGRTIERNGMTVGCLSRRPDARSGGYTLTPVQIDELAHQIVAALNATDMEG